MSLFFGQHGQPGQDHRRDALTVDLQHAQAEQEDPDEVLSCLALQCSALETQCTTKHMTMGDSVPSHKR